MKRNTLLFALIIGLISLALAGCGGNGDVTPNPYTGNYSGTYSGDESGTWLVTVNVNGSVTGTVYSPSLGNMIVSGTMSTTGKFDVSGTAMGGGEAATFHGEFHLGTPNTGFGAWLSTSGLIGQWTGSGG